VISAFSSCSILAVEGIIPRRNLRLAIIKYGLGTTDKDKNLSKINGKIASIFVFQMIMKQLDVKKN
jgi:hypothetical protein